jgi:hypothetical protein
VRVPSQVTQVSGHFDDDISEDEGDGDLGDVESNGVKHAYRDEPWSQDFFTYDPKPHEFLSRRGTSRFLTTYPVLCNYFNSFGHSLFCEK